MKKINLIFFVPLWLLICGNNLEIKETLFTPPDYNNFFVNYKEKLNTSIDDFTHHKAGDIFILIKANIMRFDNFKNTVGSMKVKMEACKPLAEELTIIAKTYDDIAKLNSELDNFRKGILNDVKIVKSESDKTYANILKDVSSLKSKIDSVNSLLIIRPNDSQLKVDLNKFSGLYNDMVQVREMWIKFNTFMVNLTNVLNQNHEKIGLLMYTIDANADIYSSAAGTLNLACNMQDLPNSLSLLVDIDNTIDLLTQSWIELDKIMDGIEGIKINR